MSSPGGTELSIDGAVATVTLNRPERRNAMTPATWLGLARIGAAIPEQVRVVVVRGAGPSFCAGIDLRLFSAEGVPGEDRPPPGDAPDFDQTIAGVPGRLPLASQSAIRLGRRRAGARYRCGLPAGPRL